VKTNDPVLSYGGQGILVFAIEENQFGLTAQVKPLRTGRNPAFGWDRPAWPWSAYRS